MVGQALLALDEGPWAESASALGMDAFGRQSRGGERAPLMVLFGTPVPQCLAALFVGLLIVVKHHENLRRLVKGEEKKI